MTTTTDYTIDTFIRDAEQSIATANGDRESVVRELTPLVERIVWSDALLDPARRVESATERPRYEYHTAPDGSLRIYIVEFAPGMPTPVHDHVTWGLIGVAGGRQRTTRYARTDDGSDETRATLEMISDEVLERGAVHPLLPPDDIHRIETIGDVPSYSFHVLGADFARQKRNIFDLETGTVTQIEGQHM